MPDISPLSVVHPNAKIGSDCVIGPFCTIGEHVEVGARTCLKSHVVVDGYTTIGEDCVVYPFVSLGIDSQDQKHIKDSVSYTRIGDRNTLREFVSVHSGTEADSATEIGNDCVLLTQAHVGLETLRRSYKARHPAPPEPSPRPLPLTQSDSCLLYTSPSPRD